MRRNQEHFHNLIAVLIHHKMSVLNWILMTGVRSLWYSIEDDTQEWDYEKQDVCLHDAKLLVNTLVIEALPKTYQVLYSNETLCSQRKKNIYIRSPKKLNQHKVVLHLHIHLSSSFAAQSKKQKIEGKNLHQIIKIVIFYSNCKIKLEKRSYYFKKILTRGSFGSFELGVEMMDHPSLLSLDTYKQCSYEYLCMVCDVRIFLSLF